MKKSQIKKLNLDALKQAEFNRAKTWFFWSNVASLGIIFVGFVANLMPEYAVWATMISCILLVCSVYSEWLSNSAKDNAEWLLRQFEMWDGLGWALGEDEISNFLLKVPPSVRNKINQVTQNKYFDSKKKQSPQRVADNVGQSAFYTKWQAIFIAKFILGVGLIIILCTFFSILFVLQNYSSSSTIPAFILIAVFQVIVGTNYLLMALDYGQFASIAGQIESNAFALSKNKQATQEAAIRLSHDYQIARSKLPLIPEWVWRVKQTEINDLWMKFRNGN